MLSIAGGVMVAAMAAQQPPPAPIVGPPIVPLEESYLRWPLPSSASAYGRIEGSHLKPYVEQLAAIFLRLTDC